MKVKVWNCETVKLWKQSQVEVSTLDNPDQFADESVKERRWRLMRSMAKKTRQGLQTMFLLKWITCCTYGNILNSHMNESGFQWMQLDESGWRWIKVDEGGCIKVQGDENICCFTCISDVIFSLSCFTVLKRKHSYDYQWSKCQKYIWVVLSLAANLMKTENFLFVARSPDQRCFQVFTQKLSSNVCRWKQLLPKTWSNQIPLDFLPSWVKFEGQSL